MAKKVVLKDNSGNKCYPVTRDECVKAGNKTVQQKLLELGNRNKNFILPISSLIKSFLPEIVTLGQAVSPINRIEGYLSKSGIVNKKTGYGEILVFKSDSLLKCDFRHKGVQAVLCLSEVSDGSELTNPIIISDTTGRTQSEFIYNPDLYIYIYCGNSPEVVTVTTASLNNSLLSNLINDIDNKINDIDNKINDIDNYAKLLKGDNLFNKDSKNIYYDSLLSSTNQVSSPSWAANFMVTGYIPIEAEKNYIANYTSTDNSINLCVVDKTKTKVLLYINKSTASAEYKFTAPKESAFVRMTIPMSKKDTFIFNEGEAVIEDAEYLKPFTTEEEVKRIINETKGGILTKDEADITYAKIVKGGNLFDKNASGFENGSLIRNNGEIYQEAYTKNFSVTPKIYVKPNTQYTSNYKPSDISIVLCVFNSLDKVIYSQSGNSQSTPEEERFVFQLTTGEDAYYVRFAFANSAKETLIFQEGSEAIDPLVVDRFITESESKTLVNGKATNWWKDKTIGLFGDSITELCGNNSTAPNSWAYYLEQMLSVKCVVRGWGGTPVRHSKWDNSSAGQNRWWFNTNGEKVTVGTSDGIQINVAGMCDWKRIITQFPATIKDTIDAIILMGGINDFRNAIKGDTVFEEYEEIPIDDNTYDIDWCNSEHYNGGDFKIKTTQGAICSAIMKLQAWMPKATIIIATQLSGRNTELNGGVNGTNQQTNSEGLNEMQFADTIIEAARYMSVPVIDMYGLTGINQQNRKYYIADGVHPYAIRDGAGVSHNNGNVAMARVFIGELNRILPKFDYVDWKDS